MAEPIRSKSFVATQMTPVKVISGRVQEKHGSTILGEELSVCLKPNFLIPISLQPNI